MTKVDLAKLEIPDDLQQCQEMLRNMIGHLSTNFDQIDEMRHQLQLLLQARYGRKAETIADGQLGIFSPEVMPEPPQDVTQEKPETKKRTHGRKKPAKELPRRRIEYTLEGDALCCPGCGRQRSKIGESVSSQYDFIPASITVIEHAVFSYSCTSCKRHTVTAPGPRKPIDKGLATAGMFAHVAIAKFEDHLPLYRQEKIFRREGVHLARSTLCDWVAHTADILTPLYECMRNRILRSRIIWTDDTPVKLLDRDDDRNIREARIWVYIGDMVNPFTIYDFTESRKRNGPQRFLAGFNGYLQADAFAGYDCIYAEGGVMEVACWAHARRKFFECLSSNRVAAEDALEMIKELYALERHGKSLSIQERRTLRVQKAAPLLHKFKKWLNTELVKHLPKSPFAKAIMYSLNNWRALCRYLCDGELEMDNNCSERALRAVAIGRKNWLFTGSREGGRNAAIISSVLASCKQHSLNPQDYLTDVITRLTSGENVDLGDLLPGIWTRRS